MDDRDTENPSSNRSDHVTDPSRPRDTLSQRLLRWLALLILAAGCLEAGIAIGWWLRDRRAQEPVSLAIEAVVDRPVIEPANAIGFVDLMPSIVGLELDQARQILFDAGITANAILTLDKPTAAESGLVVRQEPEPGSEFNDHVIITIAVAASMPDLIGLDLSDARARLAELDAAATVQRIFTDTAQSGVVLGTEPAAGEHLTSIVSLQVSST